MHESGALHRAMNHVRFMIGPELNEVQDGVQGETLNRAGYTGQSPEPRRVQGEGVNLTWFRRRGW